MSDNGTKIVNVVNVTLFIINICNLKKVKTPIVENEISYFFHVYWFLISLVWKKNVLFYCWLIHNKTHLRLFLGGRTGHKTARMASSNTVFKPFCVRAEHSKYFTELISFAMANPLKIKDLIWLVSIFYRKILYRKFHFKLAK